jgi:hypothetical protein
MLFFGGGQLADDLLGQFVVAGQGNDAILARRRLGPHPPGLDFFEPVGPVAGQAVEHPLGVAADAVSLGAVGLGINRYRSD